MATKYADFDLTTGANNGSGWADAWRSMADVIAGSNSTPPAAGDTVLMRGTDTTTAVITWNLSGAHDTGYIKLIGVDASGNNVGGNTRAVIDRNNGNSIALSVQASWVWFENIEVKNAGSSGTTYHGIHTPSGSYRDNLIFINCVSHDNKGEGFDASGGYARYATLIKCASYNNAVDGFADFVTSTFVACRSYGNTGRGFYAPLISTIHIGCIAHDNGSDGFHLYNLGSVAVNCVSHGNGGDGYALVSPNLLIGCRATGNVIGVSEEGAVRVLLLGYYGDNTTETSGNVESIAIDGVSTVVLSGTDVNGGYVDSANDDYNLASSATLRRLAVSLP